MSGTWFGTFVNIFLISFAVLALHYVYLLWNSDYWKKRGIFCPDSKALFGNLPGQVTGKRHIVYDMDDLYQEYKDKFSCIGIYQFREPRLLVFDPELIKDIMIKYFKYFQATELYERIDKKSDPLFGNHPFFLVGDEWKTKRAEVTPAFTSSRIKATFPIAEQVAEKMINFIRKEIAKPDFNGLETFDLASRFMISIVSTSIYNVDPKSFEGKESEILKMSQSFLLPSKKMIIIMMITTIYPFLKKWFKFSLTKPGAQEFFADLMNSAMKHRETNNIKTADFLDHLVTLKKKKEIDDAAIAAHGASFLVDGYESTSTIVSAALEEIGLNKEIQDKLRAEINSTMPEIEDFTYENIMNLQYLDQIGHETLRLRSPITHNARKCTIPVEIDLPKDKKLFVEKDTVLLFPLDSIHMDPEYYPNPKKFDPERFSVENGGPKAYIERGVFNVFGIGPRTCPGNRFAYSQAKIAIATIVKNFEISVMRTPKDYILHPQAMMSTKYGCYLDFKEIESK